MELFESSRSQVFAEQILNRNPNISDSLRDGCAFVHSGVVEMGSQARNRRTLRDAESFCGLRDILIIQFSYSSARRSESQTQHLRRSSNQITLLQMQLKPTNLRALHRLKRLLHDRLNRHKTLQLQPPDPLNHLPTNRLSLSTRTDNPLHSPTALLSQLHKRHLGALHTRILDPRSNRNCLPNIFLPDILQMYLLSR